jgi:hypothetical protein
MCVVPHNTTRPRRIECNHCRWQCRYRLRRLHVGYKIVCHQMLWGAHGSGGSSWGGFWEQLSPIISWIGAEMRVYGAIQVKRYYSYA